MIGTKHTGKALTGLLLGIGLLAVGGTPALADDTSSPDQELRSSLLSHDVTAQQADALVDKIDRGEQLDIDNPDVAPLSTSNYLEDGFKVIDVRYPDGSYSIGRMEIPTPVSEGPSELGTLGIQGCTVYTSGSWHVHNNCLATWDVPLGLFGHRISYRYLPGLQGAGQIDQVWGAQGGGVGYVAGSASVSIVVANGNPAISSARASFSGGGISVDRVGDFFVDSGGGWAQPIS